MDHGPSQVLRRNADVRVDAPQNRVKHPGEPVGEVRLYPGCDRIDVSRPENMNPGEAGRQQGLLGRPLVACEGHAALFGLVGPLT